MVATAGAQEPTRPSASGAAVPVIRAIEIQRGPVFDSLEARRFWGYRLANTLHAETRAYVIRRELLFAAGEPFDSARVNESERNLRALQIFQDVDIDSVETDSGIIVRVRTVDGWTTVPGFGIRTSGSQAVVTLSLEELNLFGTRTVATLGYQNDPDRSSVLVGFDTPRLIAGAVGVGAVYAQRSDGRAGSASVRYPFFSLSSRRGASVTGQFADARVLRYVGGRSRAADSLRRELALVRADGAIALAASPRGYVHLGLTAQLRREDYAPEESTAPLPRTVTAALGPYLALRRPRFIQLRNFEAFGRVEDVDLGPSLRLGVLAAPRQWGYERDGVGGTVSGAVGARFPLGFARVQAGAGALRSSDGIDSSAVNAAALFAVQPGVPHLLVGFGSVGALKNPAPGAEYDLGLGYAVRAFRAHAFTGDRHFILSGEYRWLAMPRVLGLVGVGIAGFVDHAGAWYSGSRRRTGTDAGVGLRLGPLRAAAADVGRLDLAYRFANDVEQAGWVISVGRGFGFQR